MSDSLLYDEIGMWLGHPDLYMNKLVEILNTPDDSDIGYFIEVDLNYPDNMKKTKKVPFSSENKILNTDDFGPFLKKIKPKICTKAKKVICHSTDKKII